MWTSYRLELIYLIQKFGGLPSIYLSSPFFLQVFSYSVLNKLFFFFKLSTHQQNGDFGFSRLEICQLEKFLFERILNFSLNRSSSSGIVLEKTKHWGLWMWIKFHLEDVSDHKTDYSWQYWTKQKFRTPLCYEVQKMYCKVLYWSCYYTNLIYDGINSLKIYYYQGT